MLGLRKRNTATKLAVARPWRGNASPELIEQHPAVTKLPRRQDGQGLDQLDFTSPSQLGARQNRNYATLLSFILCVVLPVLVATAYYGWFASNQYVAEFKFTVKDRTSGNTMMQQGILAALGQSSSSIGTDNYLVADYLTSRQAVDDLQARIRVVDLYTKPEIDAWSRFDAAQPIEQFVRYWQKMATAHFDQITGIVTAQVRAFSPEDALLIGNTMVQLAEELVNQIARRTQEDTVRFAEREVEKAQDRVKRVRLQVMEGGRTAENSTGTLLLDMERQIAQNLLASAMQALDQARAAARAQHLYITPYVRPSLPTSSTYPRTFLSIAAVAALAFAMWLAGLLIIRSIYERFS
jgi:capsule polysaccharide export protein KpsE/RkpR